MSRWHEFIDIFKTERARVQQQQQQLKKLRQEERWQGKFPDYHPVALWRRVIAYVVDFCIVMACFIPGMLYVASGGNGQQPVFIIGFIVGAIYFLIKDSCFDGRSAGKLLTKIIVISRITNKPCRLSASIRRNLIMLVTIYIVFKVIQFSGLLMIIGTVGVFLLGPVIEFMIAAKSPLKIRLGDRFAKTQVVYSREFAIMANPSVNHQNMSAPSK